MIAVNFQSIGALHPFLAQCGYLQSTSENRVSGFNGFVQRIRKREDIETNGSVDEVSRYDQLAERRIRRDAGLMRVRHRRRLLQDAMRSQAWLDWVTPAP